ncbi:hypothetical protein B2J93_1234 [Marssonina coronariae]|uniref:Uncharacterized protein n=1 Tax=Diplocarpon coronariae TaxID=2795749 RepID=A0A218Z3E4_9HELO|nr:hypothetical protein B2J93_1234 [Marssonina coronariae]
MPAIHHIPKTPNPRTTLPRQAWPLARGPLAQGKEEQSWEDTGGGTRAAEELARTKKANELAAVYESVRERVSKRRGDVARLTYEARFALPGGGLHACEMRSVVPPFVPRGSVSDPCLSTIRTRPVGVRARRPNSPSAMRAEKARLRLSRTGHTRTRRSFMSQVGKMCRAGGRHATRPRYRSSARRSRVRDAVQPISTAAAHARPAGRARCCAERPDLAPASPILAGERRLTSTTDDSRPDPGPGCTSKLARPSDRCALRRLRVCKALVLLVTVTGVLRICRDAGHMIVM